MDSLSRSIPLHNTLLQILTSYKRHQHVSPTSHNETYLYFVSSCIANALCTTALPHSASKSTQIRNIEREREKFIGEAIEHIVDIQISQHIQKREIYQFSIKNGRVMYSNCFVRFAFKDDVGFLISRSWGFCFKEDSVG